MEFFEKSSLVHRILLILLVSAIQPYLSSSENTEDSNNVEPQIFQTKSGPVQGILMKSQDNKDVNVLYGIPYVQPPIGELRFQKPRKVLPWTNVLKATKPLPNCYQQLPREIPKTFQKLRLSILRPWSEDCLHLNIWALHSKPTKSPVMVFIHGGAFIMGSGTLVTDATALASDGVVTVTFNYRLGVFGFYGLGNAEAPGNMGLIDQNLALQWVKENIDVFGGDPEKITLMGISAGSASVGYHLLSPMSKGLFHRAVLMSGVPTNWWAVMEPERIVKKSKALLESLGCGLPNTTAALQCLKQRHPEDILDLCRTKGFEIDNNFVPTIDGEFISEHPSVSVESGRFNVADVIIGTTADEGTMFLLSFNEDVITTPDARLFKKDFLKVIQRSFPGMSSLQGTVLEIVYKNWSNPDDPIMLRNVAKDVYSDSLFNCVVNDFADKIAQTGSRVFRYVYDYVLDLKMTPMPKWTRAMHGQDQTPILTSPHALKLIGVSENHLEVLKRFRKHISNFIINGDPNLDREEYPEEETWPHYDSHKRYLNFAEVSSIHEIGRQRQCAAWLKLIPMLENKSC